LLYVLEKGYFAILKPNNVEVKKPLIDVNTVKSPSDLPLEWELIYHLIGKGAKVPEQYQFTFACDLIYLLKTDYKRVFDVASRLNIDFDARGDHDFTPLLHFVDMGFFEDVKEILRYKEWLGIDLQAIDEFKRNAIFLAAISSLPGSTECLFDLFKERVSPLGRATVPLALTETDLPGHVQVAISLRIHQDQEVYDRLKRNYDVSFAYLLGYKAVLRSK